jgi:hypothetical protein
LPGKNRDQAPIKRMLEHRKNGREFPVPRANHQRIVCARSVSSEVGTGSLEEKARRKEQL